MSLSPDTSTEVWLQEPDRIFVATGLRFALFLSALRLVVPRIHYARPNFAKFCRGEAVEGDELVGLEEEIQGFQTGLVGLTLHQLVTLKDDLNLEPWSIPQLSHFRGRTFDRTQVEPASQAQLKAESERLGMAIDDVHLSDVYSDIIQTLMDHCAIARSRGGRVQQEPRDFHRTPRETGTLEV
ncbi:MAG: hypothetical protein CMH54_11565 [Myxococcales bacterium]|nr:hypothetical protein [Myxococcales bacterium]|tara:strand:- start:2631 stop:3179 length:549 start_codon:yes stop_codon:yes gene_type:complete